MSKRHYVITENCAVKCVACRVEFTNGADFAKHCAKGGKCLSPVQIGLTWNPLTNEWFRKPENVAARLSKAA